MPGAERPFLSREDVGAGQIRLVRHLRIRGAFQGWGAWLGGHCVPHARVLCGPNPAPAVPVWSGGTGFFAPFSPSFEPPIPGSVRLGLEIREGISGLRPGRGVLRSDLGLRRNVRSQCSSRGPRRSPGAVRCAWWARWRPWPWASRQRGPGRPSASVSSSRQWGRPRPCPRLARLQRAKARRAEGSRRVAAAAAVAVVGVCAGAAGASCAGSGVPAGERPARRGSVGLGRRRGRGQAGRAARTQRCGVPAARPGAENERDASLPPAPLGSGFPGPLGETAGAQASVRLRAAPRLGPRQVQPAENPGCLLPEALRAGLQMRRERQVTN